MKPTSAVQELSEHGEITAPGTIWSTQARTQAYYQQRPKEDGR